MDSRKLYNRFNLNMHYVWSGLGSVVGIVTGYRLDGPGIESRWGEIFCTCPDRPWGPPSLLYNGYRVFPWGKQRPERDADPSPLLVPWSWKSRAIPLLPQSLSACTWVTFTFYLHIQHFDIVFSNPIDVSNPCCIVLCVLSIRVSRVKYEGKLFLTLKSPN